MPLSEPATTPPREREARYAWIAARLAGVTWRGFETWTETTLGRRVSQKTARSVAARERRPNRQGRPTSAASPGPYGFGDWVWVDERRIGLLLYLLRVSPATTGERTALIRNLRATPGVRQLLELSSASELHAVLVVRAHADALDVRSRTQEWTAQIVSIHEISYETHAPAVETWRHLAQREVDSRGLEPPSDRR